MGFEILPNAINVPDQSLTADKVAFSDQDLADEVALAIVLSDTQTAEQYLQSKSLITALDMADDLYRAFVKPRTWPGSNVPRANLGMPLVLESVEKVLPALFMPLFSRPQPFQLIPTGKTTPEAARAKAHLLMWAIKQAGFREEVRRALKTCLLYGFFVGSYGWEEWDKEIKTYDWAEQEEGEEGERTVKAITKSMTISQPTFEVLDARKVLVDPGCNTQDVRKSAKYVIKQFYVTANDLDELRDDPTYRNVPTRDELATILAPNSEPAANSLLGSQTNTWRDLQAEAPDKPTSLDPLKQPLEILEYWGNDGRVIAVLQRKLVIRNEANEFGKLPFVSCAFIDVLNSAQGFGVAKLLAGEQRLEQGVINSWLDSLALALNPSFQMIKGIGPGTQQINVSPGRVITESGELKPLAVPSVSTEAMNAINSSEMRAARRVAANTGSNVPTQALRTAEGIQSFQGDVTQRLQYFLEMFVDLCFIPVLEAFLELMADHLTPKQINAILNEMDGKAYAGDIREVYNGTCQVQVLAGTKLMAKQAAAQLAPSLITLLSATAVQDSLVVQNRKFNYTEFLEELLELMGWDVDSLITEMTPEDQQRAQAMNPAVAKGQMDQQLEDKKQEHALDQINEKGYVQAGVAVVRQSAKSHLDEAQQIVENGGLGGQ